MFMILFAADTEEAKKCASLLDLYLDTVLEEAFAILKDKNDAEDAAQNVFTSLFSHINDPVFDDLSSSRAKAYIREATKNAALKILDAKKRRYTPSEPVNPPEEDDLSDILCRKELYQKVIEAIDSLDKIYREPLYMRYVLDYSVKEIAEMTKTKPATVEKRITRAKKLIREKVDPKDYE